MPQDTPPDRGAQSLKAARRQAYRYGAQMRGLTAGSDEHTAVGNAWSVFLDQFGNGTDGSHIIRNYLVEEYRRGVLEFDALHKHDWELV